MSTPAEPPLLFERVSPHIAQVTLNRPAARNAVSPAMAAALGEIVRLTEAEREIRAVILTGAGDAAFCAGADLKEIAAGHADALRTPEGGFAGFVEAPRRKLWIAAVRGAALAGGFEIVLACDLVVASTDASFGLPEVRRGLLASAGGVYRLPRLLPRNIALELIATGDRLDAARARALGLLNRLVPPGAVMAEAVALAEAVCANAPLAVEESLAIARLATELEEAELRGRCEAARARLMRTEDYREGPRAFAEKRTPRWTGR